MSKARKVHVKSFGCQMNVYDSHRMADLMAPAGFAETAQPDDADLIILNTANPIEFVYRPGVPAIAATIIDGQTLWPAIDS